MVKAVNNCTHQGFVKVFDRDVSEFLIHAGFIYIKEGDVFVFHATPELSAVLQQHFSTEKYVIENKLRF
jgi:hypothetical protein